MGVYSARLVPLVAEAMALLGAQHAMVVHGDQQSASGQSGIDELAISGPSDIAEVSCHPIGTAVVESSITPEQFGLGRAPLETLAGGDAAENAAILSAVFAGELGPRRDVVLLNAAAVLVVAALADNLWEGIARAVDAIDSGAVAKLVEALRRC
jgi:anthranilate phosphoribosyltransferase